MLRRLAPILIALALAWTGVVPVQAHAVLVRSVPEANASLSQSPARVDLFFSEAVDAKLSRIDVLDGKGRAAQTGAAQADPADANHLRVSLPPLGTGVYSVAWKMVSATDGHETSGAFPFAVGMAAPMPAAGAQMPASSEPLPLGEAVMKGLLYLAAAALMGRILFASWVWAPALSKAQVSPEDLQAYTRVSRWLVPGALVLLVAADLLSLAFQAGTVSGKVIGWPWDAAFLEVLGGTRFGWIAVARLGLALMMAILLLPPPNRWNRWVGAAGGAVLLLTFSLESHAAADPAPLLPLLADWVHMLAVSVWVGGLFSFLGGMWKLCSLPPETRTRLTAELIPNFTRQAMASVLALTVTGLYAGILRVGTIDALFTTQYGEALILKLAIALPMLGLGAFNFLITTPVMRKAAAQPGGGPAQVLRFRWLLSGEVALGVVILIWVGVFTSMAPARVTAAMPGFNAVATADDLRVALNVDPGQPGMNTFTATITAGGRPLQNAQEVALEFHPASGMLPPSRATMNSQGSGVYRLTGGYLGMPDMWDVKVVVIRADKFDAYADFKIDLGQAMGQAMR
jgi:copper transport protein